MWDKIRHRIEYTGVKLIYFLNKFIPYKIAIFLADCTAFFAYYVIGMRKQVTIENLRNAFPEKNDRQIKRIALAAYKQFARMLFEYVRLPHFKNKDIKNMFEFKNEHILKKSQEKGRGAIIVSGHFGSWELMGAEIARRGYPIYFLVGEQHNKLVDNLMNKLRQDKGIGIIKMGVAARGVLKALKNNNFVALLSDQDAGKNGVFVNFFNREASTPGGTAAFALKTKTDVIFTAAVRKGKYNHICYFEKIDYNDINEKNDTEAVTELTQRYTSKLEEYIRKYPDHWFWMHRRWKTKP